MIRKTSSIKNRILILILLLTVVLSSWIFFTDTKAIHLFEGRAMTIDYRIIVGGNLQEKERKDVESIIFSVFEEIDQIYNKWNPGSEISQLNKLKAGEIVALSYALENFLKLVEEIVILSEGKFDPTVEPLQDLCKEHLKNGTIPNEEAVQNLLPVVGWKNIHFGQGTFYKDHTETKLDLGGIAKGYCVDLLIERIVKCGFTDVLVEWGGEIRANGMHPDNRPWTILAGCFDEETCCFGTTMCLYNESIATSGDDEQQWNIFKDGIGTTYFHIFDPATGKPLISLPSGVASATFLAPTCVMADALATIAMMHPNINEAREWAERICEKNPEITFKLFTHNP